MLEQPSIHPYQPGENGRGAANQQGRPGPPQQRPRNPQRLYATDGVVLLCRQGFPTEHNEMWAKRFQSCVGCGTSERPHMARGLCQRCYLARYSRDNPERVATHKRAWYEQNVQGSERAKREREQKHFAGLREAALQRDGHKCRHCGASGPLVVHHKDGNGRGSKNPNNTLDNLETLCRGCHRLVHKDEVRTGRFRRQPGGRWSRQWDSCQRCGTTSRPHSARGYCTTCIAHLRRHQDIVRPSERSEEAGRNDLPHPRGE